jgi:phospholipase C
MKQTAASLVLLLGSGIALAQFPPQITNVVVIFQENRTPDNLFHFLTPACPLRSPQFPVELALEACIPYRVTTSCYDISPCGISNQHGAPVPVTLTGRPLGGAIDPDHSHKGFINMCDPDPVTFQCRNDGAWRTSSPAGSSYAYVLNPAVTNYDGSSGHLLDPYNTLATQYGWANFMYQTNQGPSYPAHQFMFSGTSAPTATADAGSMFVSENFNGQIVGKNAGCLLLNGAGNDIVFPKAGVWPPGVDAFLKGCKTYAGGSVLDCPVQNQGLTASPESNGPGKTVGIYCYPHKSMADVLDPHNITWKYYAPSPGSIWSAPDSIKSICEPQWINPMFPSLGLQCTGKEWKANVDTNNDGTDILGDITNCKLANVTWVIPDGKWSDHAGLDTQYGPSWVAAVVNAIGNNPQCPAGTTDQGQTYWKNTAIVITWDDWGGWSDHEPARLLSTLPCTSTKCQGDYQYGFRVPLIVVSAYTPQGYINNDPHDFGSVLRMIEGINHLTEGQLGFADARATTDLHAFFSLTQPRAYTTIPAQQPANYFLTNTTPAVDPDDY